GLSGIIMVDPCIVDEIKHLWSQGIKTYGSCCGHNKFDPNVAIEITDVPEMKALGYTRTKEYPNRPDIFKLKQLLS
ncbi:MAG: hypothetical protein KAJ19_22480, partial [Gammaproteobacteria bacterium]|nr:hypothetical protein [Gammaproteobacteria bacterium]